MSAEARYFRVGLFVFSGALLIGACAVVLGGQDLFKQEILLETYFDESVAGLEVGSPVKLRGVKVGTVSRIDFVGDYYDMDPEKAASKRNRIVVLMKIVTGEEGVDAPESRQARQRRMQANIEEGLRLRLVSNLVTGIKSIEADILSPEDNPPMEITWTPRNLYIPSAPSAMAALTSAAERIFSRLENVEVDKVVENLDRLIVSLTALVGDSRGAVQEVKGTVMRTRRILDGSQYDLHAALENLRVTSENLREVSETAREYPSLLLLGGAPAPSEVSAK